MSEKYKTPKDDFESPKKHKKAAKRNLEQAYYVVKEEQPPQPPQVQPEHKVEEKPEMVVQQSATRVEVPPVEERKIDKVRIPPTEESLDLMLQKEADEILHEELSKASGLTYEALHNVCDESIKRWRTTKASYDDYEFEDVNDQFYQDNDQFLANLQTYVYRTIKREQCTDKAPVNKDSLKEFPTLDSIAPKPVLKAKVTQPVKVDDRPKPKEAKDYLITDEELAPNPSFVVLADQWNNNDLKCIYGTNNPTAGDDLSFLVTAFPHFQYQILRHAYVTLGENLTVTKDFLMAYYAQHFNQPSEKKIKKSGQAPSLPNSKGSMPLSSWKDRLDASRISPEILSLSLDELKQGIMMNGHLRFIFYRSMATARAKGDHNCGNAFKDLAKTRESHLSQMLRAVQYKIISELQRNPCLNKVDFHGFYVSEALDLLELIIQYITEAITRDAITSDNAKGIVLRHGGRSIYPFQIITGKGRNSQAGPKLYPNICEYLEREKIRYKGKIEEGKIEALFELMR